MHTLQYMLQWANKCCVDTKYTIYTIILINFNAEYRCKTAARKQLAIFVYSYLQQLQNAH
jgi:hypothetical protein